MDLFFYRGQRVLVTGHTGFKGSRLCRILVNAGAEVSPRCGGTCGTIPGEMDREIRTYLGE